MKNRNMLQKWLIILFLGLIIQAVSAQNINVHGIITDETGETMIGVSVLVKGTSTGVVTDVNGNFSLSVPKNSVLSISYIGYKSQEISINGAKKLNIEMEPEAQNLDEVVVVAYGQQKKVSVTGSMSSINNEALLKSPSASLGNAISGKLPGLSTVQYSGLPGADDPVILIRGQSSFNGSSPLILVDGVERSFTQIDPNEVADITVLKDASATAVYGVRGANGVILVTTKRGEVGRTKVSASTSWGVQSVTNFIDMANSYTYATAYNNARISDGNQPAFQPAIIDHFKNHDNPLLYPDIDWIDYVMKDRALQSQHNISVSGGNQVARYFVSAGFLDQDGLFRTFDKDPNTNFSYKRYNYRANLDLSLGKYHELSINLGGRVENKHSLSSSEERIFVYLMDAQPFSGAGIVDGRWVLANRDLIDPTGLENIVSGIDGLDTFYGQGYTFSSTNVLNADIIYKLNMDFLTKGLDFRVKASYNSSYGQTKNRTCGKPASFRPYLTENGEVVYQRSGDYWNPGYSESAWSNRDWYAEASFNYNRTFGYHNVGALLLYNQSKTYYPGSYTSIPYGYVGLVARATYDYKHRYMIDANMGYNGSENFAEGKRFGFFPSVSAAWRISQESFMESTSDWLSNLKIRASYGTTGNDMDLSKNPVDKVDAFSYLQKYQLGEKYIFGNNLANTIVAGATPNYALTWATSTTYNGGLDFGFFNNRLSGTFDAFYRKEVDILGPRTVTLPSTYGQALAPENYAERSWRGGELALTWMDKAANGEITYSAYLNLGFARDRWDVLDEDATYREGGNLHALSKQGKAEGILTGLIADHLLTDPAEVEALKAKGFKQFGRDPYLGGILYKDTRGDGYSEGPDGRIDSNDEYNLLSENGTPRINYGFGGSIKWKGITLDVHFQGVGKYDRFVGGVDGGFYQHGGTIRPYFPIWTSDKVYDPELNPDGVYPRITGTSWYESGAGNTSYWMRNGAYLRLKNLNIGYDLPMAILRPLGITHAQVFANATNLFCISAVTEFLDPEQEYYDSYPLMRTFSFGLNFSF